MADPNNKPPAQTRIATGGLSREERDYLKALRQPYDTMGPKTDPVEERLNEVMKQLIMKARFPTREEAVEEIEEQEREMIMETPEPEEVAEERQDPFQSFLPPRPAPRPRPRPAPAIVEADDELPDDDEDLIMSRLP